MHVGREGVKRRVGRSSAQGRGPATRTVVFAVQSLTDHREFSASLGSVWVVWTGFSPAVEAIQDSRRR